jgi:DnaJ homolog subfamily C member 9
VLSDTRRRARYDTTGRISDSLTLADGEEDDEFAWADFYRAQFAEVITEEAIAKFKAEFQGSEEEKMAVIEAYVLAEGDLDAVFEEVMLSDPVDDEERFRAIIDHEIAEKRVEAYDRYVKETKASRRKRKQKAEKEAEAALQAAREIGVEEQLFGASSSSRARKTGKGKDKGGDESGLAALIQQRQKERATDFLADLEAKYAPKKGKGAGKRRAVDEPPEEAFQQTAQRRKRSKMHHDDEPVQTSSPRKAKKART